MDGLNDGLSMRLGPRAWLIAVRLPVLLAMSGCVAHLSRPELMPITLSQPTPLQRSAPVHARRTMRTARPVPPVPAILNEAQTEEKERLFRGFVDWQGAQHSGP